MILQLLTIARNAFIESVRQPVLLLLVLLSGILQVFNTWNTGFAMADAETGKITGDNKLLFDIGLGTVFVIGVLLAGFIATAVMSREIENKTVLTVVSKPVGRPTVVLGKYLGVAAAIVIAVVTMLLFLQMGLRHEVLSTAADEVDGPVVLFTSLAVVIALGAAVWCNFFYGWVFTQTATMLLCPLMAVAVGLVLLINKKWEVQSIGTDFKPQIAMASVCVLMAHLVLTAIATAVSARLGQVMTIVICCGIFLGGLLSNHFLGRRAIDNQFVARIAEAEPESASHVDMRKRGDGYRLTFEMEPRIRLKEGNPIFFGPNPNGVGLVNLGEMPDPAALAAMSPDQRLSDRSFPPSVLIVSAQGKEAHVRVAGADAPAVSRAPRPGDYIFLRPTRYSLPAMAAWGVVPNVQFFWLVDAVTQNQHIPPRHLGLVALYGLVQIGAFLCLGVVLFQKREVG